MKKVILNKCYGGFAVSDEGYDLYARKKGITLYKYYYDFGDCAYKRLNEDCYSVSDIYYFTKDFGDDIKSISDEDFKKYCLYLEESCREDSILIEVVEELGQQANTYYSELKVVEIPDNLDYVIDNYDGLEILHEKVREW